MPLTVKLRENVAGELSILGDPETVLGDIDAPNKLVTFTPSLTIKLPEPVYTVDSQGVWEAEFDGDGNATGFSYQVEHKFTRLVGVDMVDHLCQYPIGSGGDIAVSYRSAEDIGQVKTESFLLNEIVVDVNKERDEHLVAGSLRFTIGGERYIEKDYLVYRGYDEANGVGIFCGSVDPESSLVTINSWTRDGTNNEVYCESMMASVGNLPVSTIIFRTAIAPIKPGSLQVLFRDTLGNDYSKVIDESGSYEDGDCKFLVDWERGIVKGFFGRWRVVSELTMFDKLAPWYSASSIVMRLDVPMIWQSKMVWAENIKYNAVAQTFLPPDSTLLGIDAARLPPDGKSVIFRSGQLVLTHHTDIKTVQNLSPSQVIDCERVRLYRVSIEDTDGKQINPAQYAVDRATGLITMSATLDLTGYAAPYHVHHTIADLARIVSADINGTLSLLSPLTHDYPANASLCSGLVFAGTLQARISKVIAQANWTGEWSDNLIGAAPLAKYNMALFPIQVTNAGAYHDRILVRFTSSTEFQVIGEKLGYIGEGSTLSDCAPVNPLSGEAYFMIDYRGWGGGWATGNCLRFNVFGACVPVDLVRATQPSQPTELRDSVELLFVGNVDQ